MLMFIDSSHDVVGNADVEDTVLPIGHDIDVEVAHGERREQERKQKGYVILSVAKDLIHLGSRAWEDQRSRSFGRWQGECLGKTLPQDDVLL